MLAKHISLSENKTTLLGYFLLSAMAFCIFIAVNILVFDDIERAIDKYESPSNCIERLVNSNLENITFNDSNCKNFNTTDEKFNLTKTYNLIFPEIKLLTEINSEIKNQNRELDKVQKSINEIAIRYNILKENSQLNKKSKELDELLLNEKNLKNIIENLKTQQQTLITKNSPQLKELKDNYESAYQIYRGEYKSFKFKLFLSQLLFILPLSFVMLKIYFKLKSKDSQYTIIFSFILGSMAFLFAQIVLSLLLNILPENLAILIKELADGFFVIRYLLYYIGLFLIIFLFVAIVFIIQKVIFSKEALTFRRLKESQCPKCTFRIESNEIFCSNCGYHIKESCKNCNKPRLKDMNFCPHCRDEREKKES